MRVGDYILGLAGTRVSGWAGRARAGAHVEAGGCMDTHREVGYTGS